MDTRIVHVGFDHQFNNLRLKTSQHLNGYSASHVVGSCVSSEILKRRLLK